MPQSQSTAPAGTLVQPLRCSRIQSDDDMTLGTEESRHLRTCEEGAFQNHFSVSQSVDVFENFLDNPLLSRTLSLAYVCEFHLGNLILAHQHRCLVTVVAFLSESFVVQVQVWFATLVSAFLPSVALFFALALDTHKEP